MADNKGLKVAIIGRPQFRHERDASYWIVKGRLLEGDEKGTEAWLIADTEKGPWDIVSSGGFL